MSLGAFSGTFTTHKIRARGPNSAKFEQSSGSGPTESPRAPREVAWLARACAVGMRRSGSSRELAIAACRAAQQGPRVPLERISYSLPYSYHGNKP